jgi:hypothetical protein
LFEILKALVQDLKRRRRRRRKRRRRRRKRKEMALDAKLEVCLAHTLYPIVQGALKPSKCCLYKVMFDDRTAPLAPPKGRGAIQDACATMFFKIIFNI